MFRTKMPDAVDLRNECLDSPDSTTLSNHIIMYQEFVKIVVDCNRISIAFYISRGNVSQILEENPPSRNAGRCAGFLFGGFQYAS